MCEDETGWSCADQEALTARFGADLVKPVNGTRGRLDEGGLLVSQAVDWEYLCRMKLGELRKPAIEGNPVGFETYATQ